MLQGIQCLRAAAALLVVLHHAIDCQEKYGRGKLPVLSGFRSDFAIDLLFVVSGLVIVLVSDGRGGGWRGAAEFLRKRLARIIPTYWFFTTLMVGLALVLPQAFDRLRLDPLHTLQSYLFWPATNFQGKALPLLAVGWTLQYEMYFYLVLAGLLLAAPRLLVPGLTAVFGASVAAGLLYPQDAASLRLMTSPLLLDVLIGAWLARWHLRGLKASRPVGTALFVSGIGALLTLGTLGTELESSRVLWFGLPSAAVAWGLLSLEQSGLRAFPRALVRVGDTSYSLYLGHVFVLAALGKVWKSFGLRDAFPDVMLLAAMLLGSLVMAEISYRLVEDPSRRLLARLGTGRRKKDRGGQAQADMSSAGATPLRQAA